MRLWDLFWMGTELENISNWGEMTALQALSWLLWTNPARVSAGQTSPRFAEGHLGAAHTLRPRSASLSITRCLPCLPAGFPWRDNPGTPGCSQDPLQDLCPRAGSGHALGLPHLRSCLPAGPRSSSFPKHSGKGGHPLLCAEQSLRSLLYLVHPPLLPIVFLVQLAFPAATSLRRKHRSTRRGEEGCKLH